MVYGVLWQVDEMRDWLMSCCHWWWWPLQGLDLNILGQCLFDEAMMMVVVMMKNGNKTEF